MNVTSQIVRWEDTQVTISFTMPLKDWISLSERINTGGLPGSYPGYKVMEVIKQVTSRVSAREELTVEQPGA